HAAHGVAAEGGADHPPGSGRGAPPRAERAAHHGRPPGRPPPRGTVARPDGRPEAAPGPLLPGLTPTAVRGRDARAHARGAAAARFIRRRRPRWGRGGRWVLGCGWGQPPRVTGVSSAFHSTKRPRLSK